MDFGRRKVDHPFWRVANFGELKGLIPAEKLFPKDDKRVQKSIETFAVTAREICEVQNELRGQLNLSLAIKTAEFFQRICQRENGSGHLSDLAPRSGVARDFL
jgi:hypothetical protein